MGTIIVLIILIVCVILALKSIMKNKKKGKNFSCGGDCSRCNEKCM